MQSWQIEMNRGLRELASHRPLKAIGNFEAALLQISAADRSHPRLPVGIQKAQARVFELLGISFYRVGMRNRAVGHWVKAARLQKRGHARRRLMGATNCYGMAKQLSRGADDKHAFYGVQLARYIRSKRSHKLGTKAEIDMVVELIDEYWDQVNAGNELGQMDGTAKMSLFGDTLIVFPFLSVPEALQAEDVAVDFCHGRRIGPEDRCICGSNLPYKVCCGRTPGIDEIAIGSY